MSADRDMDDSQESGLDEPTQLDRPDDIADTPVSGLEQMDRRDIADTQESGLDEPGQLHGYDIDGTQESGLDEPGRLVGRQERLDPEIDEILFGDEKVFESPPTHVNQGRLRLGRCAGVVFERAGSDPLSATEALVNPYEHEAHTNPLEHPSSEETDVAPEGTQIVQAFEIDSEDPNSMPLLMAQMQQAPHESDIVFGIDTEDPKSMQLIVAQMQQRLQRLQDRINETDNDPITIAPSQIFDSVCVVSEGDDDDDNVVGSLRNLNQALLTIEDRQQRIEDQLRRVSRPLTVKRAVSVALLPLLLVGFTVFWNGRTRVADHLRAPICDVLQSMKDFPDFPDDTSVEDVIRSMALFDGSEFLNKDSPQSKALSWISSSRVPRSPLRIIQRYALACLYYSTSNSTDLTVSNSTSVTPWNRTNKWLTDSHECVWDNVACKDEVVSGLNLTSNGLVGTLPAELVLLRSSLVELQVTRNRNLVGTVPCFLGGFTKLAVLQAEACGLEGSFPTELTFLGNTLENLTMADNQLSGSIPTEIGTLTNLKRLELQKNFLSGPIPSEFVNISSLRLLDFEQNALTGPVPQALCAVAKKTGRPKIQGDCANCRFARTDCCHWCRVGR